jgi:hypothetical protein
MGSKSAFLTKEFKTILVLQGNLRACGQPCAKRSSAQDPAVLGFCCLIGIICKLILILPNFKHGWCFWIPQQSLSSSATW